MSPAQVAVYLGRLFGRRVSTRAVQSWCKRRRDPLPHAALGARYLIRRGDLETWLYRSGRAETPE
jgi:hypothetical protein